MAFRRDLLRLTSPSCHAYKHTILCRWDRQVVSVNLRGNLFCLYNRRRCTRLPPFAHQSLREFSPYCFFVLLEIISSQKETLLCSD